MKKFFVAVAVLYGVVSAHAQPDAGPGMAQVVQPLNAPILVGPPPPGALGPPPEDTIAQFNNPAAKLDRSSPESTVRSFVWAFNNVDIKTMRECVSNALPYEKLQQLERLRRSSYRGYNFLISDLHAYLNGDKATVTLRLLNLYKLHWDNREMTSERLHLQRKEDIWLILPDGKIHIEENAPFNGEKDVPFYEDILATQAAILASAEALPALTEQAMLTACQSNLKQISLGIMQFTQDWDEKFPFEADWRKQIQPYIRYEALLLCPGVPVDEAKYTFNPQLVLKTLAQVNAPAQTIMLFEGKDQKFKFHHQDKTMTNIAFADGHVKAYSQAALDEALKNGTVSWKP